jgi:hypothetical protein
MGEYYIIFLSASSIVYMSTQTPTKNSGKASLSELYQSSLRKPASHPRVCRLCLLCSPDCDNTRCSDPTHLTCRECADEWHLDPLCPVCKQDSFSTLKKPRRHPRDRDAAEGRTARGGRNMVVEEFEEEEASKPKNSLRSDQL